MSIDDGEIISRSLEQRAAFAELYDRHERVVYRYAARRIGLSQADDITSETFLVAFTRRGDFTGGGNARPGIAIGRVETAYNIRQDLIIDPTNGQFIGERQVTLDGVAGLPAGTQMGSTAVTTTIVDAAPTDAATCGDPE